MRITTTPPLGTVQTSQATPRPDQPRTAFELPGAGKADMPATGATRP